MEVASQHCDTIVNKTKDILDTVQIDPAAAAGHFFKFGAILPKNIHNSLSLSFSVQEKEKNQAILLHELH